MSRKAMFLDRDGVINVDTGYVYRISDFIFIDGVFQLTRAAISKGYLLFVITNQAGIGRGYYSEADFQMVTIWMLDVFESEGVHVEKVYFSPYHPVFGIGKYKKVYERTGKRIDMSFLHRNKEKSILFFLNERIKRVKIINFPGF